MTEQSDTNTRKILDLGETPSSAIHTLYEYITSWYIQLTDDPNFDALNRIKDIVNDETKSGTAGLEHYKTFLKNYGILIANLIKSCIQNHLELYSHKDKLHQLFQGTAVFPSILEIVTIMLDLSMSASSTMGFIMAPILKDILEGKEIEPDKIFKSEDYLFIGAMNLWLFFIHFREQHEKLISLLGTLKAYSLYFPAPTDAKGIESRLAEADELKKVVQEAFDSRIRLPEDKITLEVAVGTFNVSRSTLMRWIKTGKIKSYRKGNGNSEHIVSRSEIAALCQKR